MTKPSSVYVPQGKYETSDRPDVYVTAVLGSCVAACLWDEAAGVGGMNHLLLPPTGQNNDDGGIHLMELLINALLKRGAKKERLRVKLFGGGRMIDGVSDIGGRNAAFAREFFTYEGMEIVAESLGGTHARRIQFWPATGQARQRFVSNDRVEQPAPKTSAAIEGDIDLF
ncbi:MAG: chemotaxis protein CheD [Pseudomonadota bacterium]